MFDSHTSHQKPIKTDSLGRIFPRYRGWSEPFFDFPNHLRREGEAKTHKGGMEFSAVDETRGIAVKALEDSVPVLFEEVGDELAGM